MKKLICLFAALPFAAFACKTTNVSNDGASALAAASVPAYGELTDANLECSNETLSVRIDRSLRSEKISWKEFEGEWSSLQLVSFERFRGLHLYKVKAEIPNPFGAAKSISVQTFKKQLSNHQILAAEVKDETGRLSEELNCKNTSASVGDDL